MAANAYVLITCEPVRTAEIVQKLRSIRGAIVREVLGPYDFVVELETDTDEDLTAQLRHNIRTITGVTGTVTCVWL